MPTIVKPLLVAGLLLALSACSKLGVGGESDQMAWAKNALERNDRLEVVASDPQAKTFTVRVKESGQLVVLSVDQVVAGPAGALSAPDKQVAVSEAPASPPRAPETSVPEAAPPPVAPGRNDVPPPPGPPQPSVGPSAVSNGSGEAAAPGEPAQPAEATRGPRAELAAHAKAGSVLAEGPGYSIKASGPRSASTTASPAGAPRGAPEPA